MFQFQGAGLHIQMIAAGQLALVYHLGTGAALAAQPHALIQVTLIETEQAVLTQTVKQGPLSAATHRGGIEVSGVVGGQGKQPAIHFGHLQRGQLQGIGTQGVLLQLTGGLAHVAEMGIVGGAHIGIDPGEQTGGLYSTGEPRTNPLLMVERAQRVVLRGHQTQVAKTLIQ